MKKGTYVLIILLIFFLLITVTMVAFFYFQFGKPPAVKYHSYLEFNLSGNIQEKTTPDFFTTFFMGGSGLSMYDIWTNFQKAKVDNRIDSIVIRLGYLMCGWAKINELRELIIDFRKSGKKVIVYIEEALEFDKEYYLATACDKIIMHPEGFLIINGIGGYIPFVKKALDKLGIEMEVEHVEEYKTAYHMFTEEKLTPHHREMLESIYENLYSHYIDTISEARGKSPQAMKELIDHGFFQGNEAKEAGLVDDLLYEDKLLELIKENNQKVTRITHPQYLKTKPSSLGLDKGKKIALIYGMGPIVTGEGYFQMMGSHTISRWIKRARLDKSITAIVFRVDSPGGSVVASDTIWREITLAKKEKPVIVSMSDLAGSGGYQVAIAAHKILAQPQTLTGSIGVIFAKPNLKKLYDNLGITAEKIQFGKRADMFSSFRKATPEERKMLKDKIKLTYDRFVSKVAKGRKMSVEAVNNIGKGRVWTGKQALEIGLIDEIGGLSRAIEIAKELAGIPHEESVKLVVWPKKISFFEGIVGRRLIKTNLILSPKVEKIFSIFKLLEKENPWALMPFWITAE